MSTHKGIRMANAQSAEDERCILVPIVRARTALPGLSAIRQLLFGKHRNVAEPRLAPLTGKPRTGTDVPGSKTMRWVAAFQRQRH